MTDSGDIYLIFSTEGGRRPVLFGVEFDESTACERASYIEGVVIACPIIADNRPEDQEDDK